MFSTILANLLALLAAPQHAPVPDPGYMYMLAGDKFLIVDARDGQVLSLQTIKLQMLPAGLTYDDGWLYFIDQNIGLLRDRLIKLKPASAEPFEVGKTGYTIGNAFVSMARHPKTHRMFANFAQSTWTIDQTNGKAGFLSRMSQQSFISAIAINGDGVAYGAESSFSGQARPRLYVLELHTGELSLLGELPVGYGDFESLAFDMGGRLWGYFRDLLEPARSGFYIIDLDTLQTQKPFELLLPVSGGFTFGPSPEVEEYCTGKRNSLGCIPSIGWKGLPSASASKGFEVFCRNVRVNEPGLLFLSTSGRAAKPFLGGFLCLEPPILRTPAVSAGGPPPPPWTCDGHWEVDVNAFLHDNGPLTAGAVLQAQWWGRDAGFVTPDDNQLSDALEITLMP